MFTTRRYPVSRFTGFALPLVAASKSLMAIPNILRTDGTPNSFANMFARIAFNAAGSTAKIGAFMAPTSLTSAHLTSDTPFNLGATGSVSVATVANGIAQTNMGNALAFGPHQMMCLSYAATVGFTPTWGATDILQGTDEPVPTYFPSRTSMVTFDSLWPQNGIGGAINQSLETAQAEAICWIGSVSARDRAAVIDYLGQQAIIDPDAAPPPTIGDALPRDGIAQLRLCDATETDAVEGLHPLQQDTACWRLCAITADRDGTTFQPEWLDASLVLPGGWYLVGAEASGTSADSLTPGTSAKLALSDAGRQAIASARVHIPPTAIALLVRSWSQQSYADPINTALRLGLSVW